MKRLTCEVCGSSDIKKEDNTYVCESCGCKYSIEEVKKLFVEGEITVNENHNYNVSHEVSGQVEMVAKDNTAEEINRIIRSYDRDLKNAREMQDCLSSWEHHYSLFNEGGFALNYPKLPETWLGLLYLQTMAFTFDRETCNELCEQMPRTNPGEWDDYAKITFEDDELEGGYIYYHYFDDDGNQDHIQALDSRNLPVIYEGDYKWEYSPLKYYCSSKKILKHLKELSNHPDISQQQKDKIKDYRKRLKKLKTKLWDKYAPNSYHTSNSASSSQGSSFNSQSSGGCYIATAVYGSYDCPEVWTLRRYRDRYLAKTWYGRTFIHTYYAISPTLVKWFGDTNWFKGIWRERLDRMVKKLQSEGYASTPYKDAE